MSDVIRTEKQLREEGWVDDDLIVYRNIIKHYESVNSRLKALTGVKSSDILVKRLMLQSFLDIIEFQLKYAGKNPKEVPLDELREIQRSNYNGPISVETAYRKRIKNRGTGIRAFCVTCQGGSLVEVRTCVSTSCPLWPFRMGGDPLAGKVKKIIEKEPLEEDEGFEEEGTDDVENTDEKD